MVELFPKRQTEQIKAIEYNFHARGRNGRGEVIQPSFLISFFVHNSRLTTSFKPSWWCWWQTVFRSLRLVCVFYKCIKEAFTSKIKHLGDKICWLLVIIQDSFDGFRAVWSCQLMVLCFVVRLICSSNFINEV